MNLVRDTKGLDLIVNIVIANIIKLDVDCVLWGATSTNPREELEQHEYYFPDNIKEKTSRDPNQLFLFKDVQDEVIDKKEHEIDEQEITWDEFDERLTDYLKYVSDYGREPLQEIALDLIRAKTDAEKIMLCDKAFAASHSTYDLTEIFFKNGSSDASELSGENYENFVPVFYKQISLFENF